MRKLFPAAAALALGCIPTAALADQIELSSGQVVGNTGVFNPGSLFDEQTGAVSLFGLPATTGSWATITFDLGSATDFERINLFSSIRGAFLLIGGDSIFYDPFTGYYINGGVELARGAFGADAGVSGELTAQSFSIASMASYRYVNLYFTGGTETQPGPGALNEVRLFDRGAVAAVPEPATWAMMLLGLGACGVALRRSRRRLALA